MFFFKKIVSIALLVLYSQHSIAWEFFGERDRIYLMGAGYSHFSSSDDHQGAPVLVSAEVLKRNKWFYGISLFNNSFGQFSQYLYVGKEFKFDNVMKGLRSKISVGLIHGYRDEFKNKIPLNKLGLAPVIIPSIGYQKKKWGFDVFLMGHAGLLFGVGYKF